MKKVFTEPEVNVVAFVTESIAAGGNMGDMSDIFT